VYVLCGNSILHVGCLAVLFCCTSNCNLPKHTPHGTNKQGTEHQSFTEITPLTPGKSDFCLFFVIYPLNSINYKQKNVAADVTKGVLFRVELDTMISPKYLLQLSRNHLNSQQIKNRLEYGVFIHFTTKANQRQSINVYLL
jgi:hypothetical protein